MSPFRKIIGLACIPMVFMLNASPWPDLPPVTDVAFNSVGVADDMDPIPLPNMICFSDVIVLGTVNGISEGVLDFTVDVLIMGSLKDEDIRIADYVPRQFSGGSPIPCKEGDKFIFFLLEEKEQGLGHDWNIFGLLGEGKLPVEDEFVYFPGLYLEGLEKKYYSLHGEMQYLYRQDLADFTDAVSGYNECVTCEIISVEGRQSTRYSTDCQETWIKEFSERSWIHGYLIRRSGLPRLK